jgi:hypothetical protein
VSPFELVSYANPLDLLRRFAPTPLKAEVCLGTAKVVLETNDLSFLPSLSRMDLGESCAESCSWKIVRDVDARGMTGETTILMAGNVIVYSMGPACLIGADRERREILAFIGRDVDAQAFQESILPALCRLTEFVARRQQEPAKVQSTHVPMGGPCNA